ncbi:arginine--tRNA ligase [soil metagenome]
MKNYLTIKLQETLENLGIKNAKISFDKPKEEKFGDLSTNIALILAKELKEKPRVIAERILNELQLDDSLISKCEIAGAGFLNFYISDRFYLKELDNILKLGDNYGRSDLNINKKADLEWVSANPTGPLHTGHGRQVCLGKSIANLLEWTGYSVTREYYYNDAGTQMTNLALSVKARYEQIFDNEYPFPEEGYTGDYINDIATAIYEVRSDELKGSNDLDIFKKAGENYNFRQIKKILQMLNITHDVYFNESSLYNNGKIDALIAKFMESGMAYEKDGALWLKMDESEGFEKDKVIRKNTGEPTYRLPDMAYHINKLERGFDLIIDIFGADHGDTYKEVLYGVRKAGFDTSRIKVIIHQMVTLRKGDELLKMSKRSGNVYSLEELIDDIGADAVQFFFVMRGVNTHLDFDIELAAERSDKNPVYYLQYAHARICGILRNSEENFHGLLEMNYNSTLIKTKDEINLLKTLSRFKEEVEIAASTYEPHKIITYLNETADKFHKFYHENRVLDPENKELSAARLKICIAAKQVFKNGFNIIGISAPDRM